MIDRGTLDELLATTGDDPAFLAELIDTYLSDAAVLLATMHQAAVAGSSDELRRAAHSLKSNSASLGARELASLCLEVEQQARAGALDGAAERVVAIEVAFAEVASELRELQRAAS
jgi:HPt (histidine-containing phosphotransfer) domain-containing protein